jgi:TRL-like protein family
MHPLNHFTEGPIVMNKLFAFAALAALTTGCSNVPIGTLYANVEYPSGINQVQAGGAGKTGTKSGEACVSGILALVATGDASLDAAKKAGGITDVHSVEVKQTNILGIINSVCTIVHGQ